MFFYMKRGAIIASPEPIAEEPVVMSSDETVAAEAVFAALAEADISASDVSFERAKDYLKVCAGSDICFCRLKLSGRSLYIELSLSSADMKELSGDPRFASVAPSQKRFTRLPLHGAGDVAGYSDLIPRAFRWATV